MFRKETRAFGGLTEVQLYNQEQNFLMSIIVDYGANIRELILESHTVIRGVKNDNELIKDKAFKSSHLLPWPNRIKDGVFHHNEQKHQLPINEEPRHHALHGFVYQLPFEIIDEQFEEHAAAITLQNKYLGDFPGYPFRFTTTLKYHLSDVHGLSIQTSVKSDETQYHIPMGIGWHPYFQFDMPVDRLELQLPTVEKYDLDERAIPRGSKKLYSEFAASKRIANTQFDDCFRLIEPMEKAETRVNVAEQMELIFWQETGENKFNYLQVYTPPDRNAIAIEPMTCAIDAFNNQDGLILLKPGESIDGSYGVMLSV